MKELTFLFKGKGTIRWEDIHQAKPELEKITLTQMSPEELTSLWEELSEMDSSMKAQGESGIIHKIELPPEEKPSEQPTQSDAVSSGKTEEGDKLTGESQTSEQETGKHNTDATQTESFQEEHENMPEELDMADIDTGGMESIDMGGGFEGGDLGGGWTGDGGATNVANKPKLIISNYVLNPATPQAGREFELHLTFTNTNAEKSVRNIKISLGGGEAAATPSANGNALSEMGATTTAMGGGSVFTPVNSSNTFYISRINPEETADKTIHFRTAPTLAAQNYAINVTFEYEDADGNEFTATETIGIPVVQASEILLGEVTVSGESEDEPLRLDSPAYVDLDLYNIGKDPLTNFMVTIQGEGFEVKDSPRYFIGNFAVGASDHFSAEIVPKSANGKGTILITYEDSTGKKHEEKTAFDFTAEDLAGEYIVDPSKLRMDDKTGLLVDDELGEYYDPITMEQVPAPETGISIPFVPIGIAVVVIVGIVLFLRRRRKKKHQQEELNLDA